MQHVTWVAFSQGRTLVGVDSSQVEFNAVNKTGGAKTVTLTVEQMPRHRHGDRRTHGGDYGHGGDRWTINNPPTGYLITNQGDFSGGSQPHSNLQPYQTCYIWQRAA